MRLFTLVLPLAAALLLVVPATAARKPPATTAAKFGAPVFVSMPSADGIHRDITFTVPFTHETTVAVHETITTNGVFHDLGVWGNYRGSGSDTFRWSILGTDGCFPPLPGNTVSYHLELISSKGAVLDQITTQTYVIT